MSVGALVRPSGNQSISTGTFTTVTYWDTEVYQDVTGIWTVGDPSKLIVPAGYNYAQINVGITWEATLTNDRIGLLWMNGSTFPGSSSETFRGSTMQQTRMCMATFVPVSEGDYFEVRVWQNTGGPENIITGNAPFFGIELFT